MSLSAKQEPQFPLLIFFLSLKDALKNKCGRLFSNPSEPLQVSNVPVLSESEGDLPSLVLHNYVSETPS